jgi:general secretion pathway protein M
VSTRSLTLPAPLASLRQRADAAWSALSRRDRRIAKLGALVVAVALIWLIGVQPALRTVREAPSQLDSLDAELQQMQLLAAESRTLRAAPAVAPAQAATALSAATARLGARARLVLQGERAIVTLTGVDSESLRNLLTEVRSTARARPIEAQLVRRATGYDGTLTLGLGGAP